LTVIGQDPQRYLAAPDAPAELQPAAKPGDVLGHDPALMALSSQQHAVARRIRMEHRPHANPPPPALRGQQLLGRSLETLAISAMALRALLLGHRARRLPGHDGSL